MGVGQSNSFKVIGYEDTHIDFEDHWFAEGESRRVYRGRFRGDHRVHGKQGVVKVYKQSYSLDKDEFAWEADDRAYRKADAIAQMFNKMYETSKPIEFIQPEFSDVDPRIAVDFLGFKESDSSTYIPEKVTIAVERYLEGNYVKFSNNTGYVIPKQMATPAAFSHYSYHVSDGEILVCDLQGLRTDTNYKLTDPAVHSGTKKFEYGPNDWGKCGIVSFFQTHECNALCEGLKKPKKAFDCTADKWEEFTEVASKMPGGKSTANTFVLGKACGISKPRFEAMQKEMELIAA